jgi:hypothetical protein
MIKLSFDDNDFFSQSDDNDKFLTNQRAYTSYRMKRHLLVWLKNMAISNQLSLPWQTRQLILIYLINTVS